MKFSRNEVLKFGFVALLGLVGIQLLFMGAQHLHTQLAHKSIEGLLRKELYQSIGPYESVRTLEDWDSLGILRCVKLTQLTPTERVYFDLSFKGGNCHPLSFALTGQRVETTFMGLNGQGWKLSFVSNNGQIFYLFLWFVRIIFCTLVALILIQLKRQREYANSLVEIERKSLEERQEDLRMLAHDLGSPIAILESISPDVNNPLYGQVIQRMIDISDEILSKKDKIQCEVDMVNANSISPESVDLKALIEKILRYKQVEYQGKGSVQFKPNLDHLNIVIPKGPLERVLSNLLNNAAEAMNWNGTIKITMNNRNLIIEDDGPGFPEQVLSSLGEKRITVGKKNGHGIGVFSAIHFFKNAHVEYSFINKPNQSGAIIKMQF